jgi:hypothetical protein
MLAATVPGEDLESAVAVNSLSLQLARFVGPAIAGFLLASAGPTWVFGANAASFVAVLAVLAFLPASRTVRVKASKLGGGIMDGLRFMLGRRSLASLMLLLVLAGLFGTPPVAFMIPAIVRFQLHAGAGARSARFPPASASARFLARLRSWRSRDGRTRESRFSPAST